MSCPRLKTPDRAFSLTEYLSICYSGNWLATKTWVYLKGYMFVDAQALLHLVHNEKEHSKSVRKEPQLKLEMNLLINTHENWHR